MEDEQIIALYWNRLETAIEETSHKYGRYCYYIAYNILKNKEDCEECVSDTYLKVWNSIPDARPGNFRAFLGKITRNEALHKWEKSHAKKRGEGMVDVVLEELQECILQKNSTEDITEQIVLTDVLNHFLEELSVENRKIFVARYWYFASIKEIALRYHLSESKVKMQLFRLRRKLKEYLEKEKIVL